MKEYIEVVNKVKRRENDLVVKKIKEWLEKNIPKNEYIYYKNWGGGFNKSGRPDFEIAYKGLVNYFEAKDPLGRLSTIQIEVIKSYSRAGITVHVVTSLDNFLEIWYNIYKK